MEIVQQREASRIAKVFSALARAFSRPESVPAIVPKIVITTDGSPRSHCGVLLVGDTCAVCGVRPSWRDGP